ncbi:MAG: efflux RND transporter periplasmic adaptor subunit [Bacteroidales bacterium]
MENNSSKHSLLMGLLGLIGVIAIVSLIGLFAAKPDALIIQGEAEATEFRVSGKVPGRIKEFKFEEGMAVKRGDTLVLIDSPELLAKIDQAQAAQSAAEAQNRKAIKGARQELIMGAYEMWQKAEVGVEITKKSFDRVQKLYDKEVVSAQKRDEAEAQYKAAVATAKAAKSQYQMAVNGAEQEDKASALALVNRAKGAVSEVKSYLGEIFLVSPIDGEVSEIFPKHGELVGTGAPIMTITNLEDIWFTFSVREDILNGMQIGNTLKLKIPALGNKEVEAKVTFIKAMASYATWRSTKVSGQFDAKTFEVRAKPTAKVEGLRPGMTAIVETVVK